MDISVGRWYLPTRRRTGRLAQFFHSAIETGISTPGVVLVQEDEYAELFEHYEAITLPAGWDYRLTKADGMGDKLREAFADISQHDWFGWLVDDLICETPEWDKKLLAGLNGKNFVSADDGGQNPRRMCVPVFSKAVIQATGYIYPPGFWHTYVDDVWETLGRDAQCWQIAPEIILKHDHPFKGGEIVGMDETGRISYSRMSDDAKAFERWTKYVKPQSVARIKAMQRGT